MYPVLLDIGNFQLSSYGFFLAIGIFLGSFSAWRIAKVYEVDSEKILDITFLSIGIGFIFARLLFVLVHLEEFDSLAKVIFINKYPGLNFWGGFIGGLVVLFKLAKRNKITIWQAGDFALVGFLLAAFFTEIGCLLGGCGVGIESNLFFGVSQIGVIGKRLPIQFFEAIIFLFGFLIFWRSIIKFYILGSIFAKGLILVSIVKLGASILKEKPSTINSFNQVINIDLIISVVTLIYGFKVLYQVYKKTPVDDLKFVWRMITDRKTQTQAVAKVNKEWYNHWVNLRIGLERSRKKLFKLLNIKPNPDNF